MKAFILITVRTGYIAEVLSHLTRVAGIREANMTFGPYDIVAMAEADDLQSLGKMLAEDVHPIPGIEETLTCLAVD